VRGNGFGFGQNHTSFNLFAIDTAQQDTSVVTSATFIELFVEHFNARSNSGQRLVHQTNDFNGLVQPQSTTLNTTGHNSTAALDRKDVFNWHEEIFFEVTHWFLKVVVNSIH